MLGHPRLAAEIAQRPPSGAVQVHVPANLLVHRDAWKKLAHVDLDDGTVTLADPRRWPSVDAPYAFDPLLVDSAAAARRAEALLFRSLRKPQDGWTSRWLNRYISLFLSRLLIRTPLSPNQISVGILAVGLCGAWLASGGTPARLFAGAVLFQAQSVLDGCDGEVSRVTYRGSLLGEWLDTIGDDLTNYAFFGACGWGLHAHAQSLLYGGAGLVVVIAGVLTSGIEYRYLLSIGSGDLLRYPVSQASAAGGRGLAALTPLFKRDTFVLLTLVAAALGLTGPMLVVFALASVGILGRVLAAEWRMRGSRSTSVEP